MLQRASLRYISFSARCSVFHFCVCNIPCVCVCVSQGLVCASGQSLCSICQTRCTSAALPESGLRPACHQPAACRAAEHHYIAATMLSGLFLDNSRGDETEHFAVRQLCRPLHAQKQQILSRVVSLRSLWSQKRAVTVQTGRRFCIRR